MNATTGYSAECSHILQTQGKAYPRTCMLCGLGPCRNAPPKLPDIVLSGEDAHFLAVRLRRLCAHLNYTLPKFAGDDASLINIAGTVLGALLTNMTHGVQEGGNG